MRFPSLFAILLALGSGLPASALAQQPPVIGEKGDTPALLGPKWWGYLFMRFGAGTEARTFDTAAGEVDGDEIFMGGGGADLPLARFLTGAFGAYYCGADGKIPNAGAASRYTANTVLIDAQLRPSFRVGRARMWAGGGMAYAFVETQYKGIAGNPGKKSARSHSFAPVFGGGVDLTLRNASSPQAGPDLLLTLAFESGSPTYDEKFEAQDFGGETRKNVGFAVPPTRVYAGIGLGFGGGR